MSRNRMARTFTGSRTGAARISNYDGLYRVSANFLNYVVENTIASRN